MIAVHVIFLALLPFAVSSAPPLDIVEGLIWGQEWLIGTHKLPPGPAWLVEIALHLTGSPILGPFLVSQIFVGLTFICVFAAGRRLTTTENALTGTLLLAGVAYFTWPTTEFNHNVIQMPIWAVALLLFTIIREDPQRPLPWLLLGLIAGIGIYAKYSVIIFYLVLVIWALIEGRIRRALLTPWPWIAVAVSLLVSAPHIKWMIDTNFEQIEFARSRTESDGSLLPLIEWTLVQIAFHLPVGLLLLVVGRKVIRSLPHLDDPTGNFAFVAFMAIAPAAAVVLLALVTGSRPEQMWGIPMYPFSGLLVVFLLRREWGDLPVNRLWSASVSLVAMVGIAFTGSIVASSLRWRPYSKRMADGGDRGKSTHCVEYSLSDQAADRLRRELASWSRLDWQP